MYCASDKTIPGVSSSQSSKNVKDGRHIEGHWVLGMIENDCEDLRLEVCPQNMRSSEVLMPLIKKRG
ncbi:unnamed protein product [Parnassius apollo]|uniref:(apollo) hypothetical protein n=1 Tax=Parnassius apollo TaxID=110799 RepID=A0A8S3W8F1_PARAO|nr:unnamed protein product [Parnassius apollo]